MTRLTREQVARIKAKAQATLAEPTPFAADSLVLSQLVVSGFEQAELLQQIATYKESLLIFEGWVAALERALRAAGMDPTDLNWTTENL